MFVSAITVQILLLLLVFSYGQVHDILRTFLPHFWVGVSHVHVYACLRKAYRLTSHSQGAWRNRRALRTMHNKIAYFIHAPAQKWARIVLRIGLLWKFLLNPVKSYWAKGTAMNAQRKGKKTLFLVERLLSPYLCLNCSRSNFPVVTCV